MTEKEIDEENHKIYLHNKFCFMKKKIPYYKPIVPLTHSIVLFMVSACLFALPSLLKIGSEGVWSCAPNTCKVVNEK